MVWYRDKRIKTEFGMSIMGRRRELDRGIIKSKDKEVQQNGTTPCTAGTSARGSMERTVETKARATVAHHQPGRP